MTSCGEAGQQVRAGQGAGVGGVEVAGQVVHQHQAGALGRVADGGLPGEEALGLGEQLDELLRSLGHGGTSLVVRTDDRCSRRRRRRIPIVPRREASVRAVAVRRAAGRVGGRGDLLAHQLGAGLVALDPGLGAVGGDLGWRPSSSSRTYR